MEQNYMELSVQEKYLDLRMRFPAGDIMETCIYNTDMYNSQIAAMIKKGPIDVKELRNIESNLLQEKELFYMAHLDSVISDCPDKSMMH